MPKSSAKVFAWSTSPARATDFDRYKYSYDRAGNRTKRENVVYAARSQKFTYNDLYQLTQSDEGILDSGGSVALSDLQLGFNMDVLGNLNGTNGLKINGVNDAIKHTTNETNEITTLAKGSPGGAAKVIDDDFATSLSSIWAADKGTWSISTGQVNVDTLSLGNALLAADATLDSGAISVKVTFPASSSTNKAGVIFSYDGTTKFYAVVLNRSTGKIALYNAIFGTEWGSPLASAKATIADSTQYTIKVFHTQRHVYAEKVGESGASFTYDSSTDFGQGEVGLYSDKTDVKFDDFFFTRGDGDVSTHPRWGGTAKIGLSLNDQELNVQGGDYGGELVLNGFTDDNYIAQYDTDLNSGADSVGLVRFVDHENHYRVELTSSSVDLVKVWRGKHSSVATGSHSETGWITVKTLLSGTTIKVWVAGVLKITATNSAIASGGFGLAGETPKFKNIKIGYDKSDPPDDDIDDVVDDIVYDDDFSTTNTTVTHDSNGNLTNDGTYKYTYDAWNRLVKVESQHDNLTLATYKYDGVGRRIKKAERDR